MKRTVAKNLIHSEQYSRLVELFEQMSALLRQMGHEEYQDFSVYLNNLRHIERYNGSLNTILQDEDFVCWLKKRDMELHCNIMATRIAFRMLDNLVVNLRQIFTSLK